MQPRPDLPAYLRRRSGFYLNRARRSVWLHAHAPSDFETARPMLQALRDKIAFDRFLFTSPDPATCAWLRTRFPNDNALPPPWGSRFLIDRFFRQLHPLLLLATVDAPLPPALLARARRDGVPVLVVDGTASLDPTALEAALARVPAPDGEVLDRTAPRRMDQLAQTPVGRWLVARRGGRRLDDVAALRRRLGQPQAILCLGNGPSSEDPAVSNFRFDTLFRVNWRWLERGLLTEPDVVFVGDLRTPARVRNSIYGFRTLAWESEVLLRHLLLHGGIRPLEHFTYARTSTFLDDANWAAHPTNGMLMIATATALRPARLAIGGIDLYLDPRGRYPGDPSPENEFPQMHSRDVEIEILVHLLTAYAGELVVFGDPLRRLLEQRGIRFASAP